jgi:hypothetical protein
MHGFLTAAFGADRNHGVKRVLVWVDIAILHTRNGQSASYTMHPRTDIGGSFDSARTLRTLKAAIASGSASRSAQARNNLQATGGNTPHATSALRPQSKHPSGASGLPIDRGCSERNAGNNGPLAQAERACQLAGIH